MKNKIAKILLGSALAVAVTLPVGTATFADHDWGNDCRERLEHDRARIDRDAAKYGEHSRAVDHDVDRMEADRHWCRDHHADYDHDRFEIGLYVHPH